MVVLTGRPAALYSELVAPSKGIVSALVLVSALACVVVAGAGIALSPRQRRRELAMRAVLAAGVASSVACTLGVLLDLESPDFLLALSVSVGPLALVVGSVLETAGARRAEVWSVVMGWAVVAFPFAVLAPPFIASACGLADCGAEDFGGVLAVVVSTAAATLVGVLAIGRDAASPPGVPSGASLAWTRIAAVAGLMWLSSAVWLVSLEGVIDEYMVHIATSAFLAPLGGLFAWGAVLVGRGVDPRQPRTLLGGLGSGFIAVLAGAASLSPASALLTGVLGGAVGAGILGTRTGTVSARRGAIGALAVAAVGLMAPAVVGETTGFVFSGRLAAVVPPAALFVLVAAASAVVAGGAAGIARFAARRA
ncbi:hypothetical protein [Salinibacterium sp. ZJ70]|uniref:hypothetical protein n=1 Tax=Salinibacterium sp. ZJ70 TaxID=2708084 RepID=UPI00141FEA7A|nr:hypothetical protein [Salinibacterium sp. ZJ70]